MSLNRQQLKDELEGIAQNLKADPKSGKLANRYWAALAETRSGRDVMATFREAALASSIGAAAFAKAYRELFETSGELTRCCEIGVTG